MHVLQRISTLACIAIALMCAPGIAQALDKPSGDIVLTVGGAIASCVFGIALINGAVAGGTAAAEGTAGSFSGYLTVWIVCGVTALISAVLLALVVPKRAFTDAAAAPTATI